MHRGSRRNGAVGLPEVELSVQPKNAKSLATKPSKFEKLTNAGNNAATWWLKTFQKTRQRVPFFNWLVKYGVPMASATLFTLDIVRFYRGISSWNFCLFPGCPLVDAVRNVHLRSFAPCGRALHRYCSLVM
jgi:hypothetical protein